MSLNLLPEKREQGKQEFAVEVGRQINRRDFMKGLLAGTAAIPVSAALYYGYDKFHGEPVRAALIGCGDQGGVLVGEHNPEYLRFVAVCDIRPYNLRRIFEGEGRAPRWGLVRKYGSHARKEIEVFHDYHEMLEKRKDIQAVVIAVPLHLHAKIAIDCLRAGKHVFCEKLMAWNVRQCKEMIRAARETDRVLAIGHQRHYNLLYAYAYELIRAGTLGVIKHIRALWHRNQTWPVLERDRDGKLRPKVENNQPVLRDSWRPEIRDEDLNYAPLLEKLTYYGYRNLNELVRWRLYLRTGGGLMAELGSHQLDACSIFLGKVHPLAVTAIGGKHFFQDDREVEDHVYCIYEFPGQNYYERDDKGQIVYELRQGRKVPKVNDDNDVVVVTYSSICTNAFEPYGECVMGTRGTLIVEREQEAMFFPEADPNARQSGSAVTTVQVTQGAANKPAVDSSASEPRAELLRRGQGALPNPVSRGYREELEHFAFCVKMWEDREVKPEERPWPRCHGEVAMADAIIALTANVAMRGAEGTGPRRIEFQPEWFDPMNLDALPDPHVKEYGPPFE
ncbi:MAG: Gfo/Idh/MocA family oxidoreductase [Gemmatales bacterium]|nr:Gfo/Idh/MocA family oxidoreductase [Gemmatales bacterium]MDW7995749.1 Gfo/Idh/MocA family oxidoreductase [Gemmatales bacterium]